jgi:hypothetical protein
MTINQVAIGRDENGLFRTAALKEYPHAFSAALAATVADQLREVVRTKTWPTSACPRIRENAISLPDYQGA